MSCWNYIIIGVWITLSFTSTLSVIRSKLLLGQSHVNIQRQQKAEDNK